MWCIGNNFNQGVIDSFIVVANSFSKIVIMILLLSHCAFVPQIGSSEIFEPHYVTISFFLSIVILHN